MGEASLQVPSLLSGLIAQNGIGFTSAIVLKVARMVGTPLLGAFTTNLAILVIGQKLVPAILISTLPLTLILHARFLRRMKWGWFELLVTKTTTVLHPFSVPGDLVNVPNSSCKNPG
jgi:hypothetical protein